jgi:hypothetical protein
MDIKSTDTGAKPIVRGKGKALNAIAAASGRDPAAIVAAAAAARARMEEEEAAEAAAKREKEKSVSEAAAAAVEFEVDADADDDDDDEEELGQTPSRIYNQLTEHDRYRFECFRRCGFPSRPMEQFIAKMLVEEAEKRYITRGGVKVGMGMFDATVSSSIITLDDASATKTRSDKANNNSDTSRNKRKKKQSMKRMLKEESKRRRVAMDQPFPNYYHPTGGCSSSSAAAASKNVPPPPPKLEHLVVPSSASEIVAVVSTLAKCYAQRLVAAACRVDDAEKEKQVMDEQHQGSTTNSSSAAATASATTITTQQPLQPHHLLDAHMHRVRAGLDPGFWMSSRIGQQQRRQPSVGGGLGGNVKGVGVMEAAALGTYDWDRECYLAALAAQDANDREVADVEDNECESEVQVDVMAEDCEMKIDEQDD